MSRQDIDMPFIVRDVTLMSPGTWNGWTYNPEELKKAYISTDWSDEHVTSLFLDHPENPHNAAGDWIGRIKNPKQLDDSTIKGDLEIWDEDIAYKLSIAKARMGVSPRIVGTEDEENMSFLDFFFDNFSVVSKPAQSTAAINLSDRLRFIGIVKQLSREDVEELKKITGFETERKKKGMSPAEFYAAPRDPPSSSALPIFDKAHAQNAMSRFNQTRFKSAEEKAKAKRKIITAAKKFGIEVSDKFKEMAHEHGRIMEIMEKLRAKEELTDDDIMYLIEVLGELSEIPEDMALHGIKKKKKKSSSTKLKGGKKDMAEEKEKEETEEEKEEESDDSKSKESEESKSSELSDGVVLSIMNEDLDSFNDYAKRVKISEPDISLKDLAKKYKEHQEQLKFVEELSDAEALVLLKTLSNRLGSQDSVLKKSGNSGSRELSRKIADLEKTVKELSKSPKIAKPKTVGGTSSPSDTTFRVISKSPTEGVQELAAAILQTR